MAFCILLMLPFISPPTWRKIFKSRLFNALTTYGNIYFTILLAILVILFIDGVRDVSHYSKPLTTEERNNPTAEVNLHMKLFRAQRNFYIAGFALFLSFVIRRLITLISAHGALQADCDAAKRQAESATEAAKRFMENAESKQDKTKEADDDKKKRVEEFEKEIETLKDELTHSKTDMEAMKQQAASTNREYDRLLEEHSKLQAKLKLLEGGKTESKKDEWIMQQFDFSHARVTGAIYGRLRLEIWEPDCRNGIIDKRIAVSFLQPELLSN